jgi:hypothetical protein
MAESKWALYGYNNFDSKAVRYIDNRRKSGRNRLSELIAAMKLEFFDIHNFHNYDFSPLILVLGTVAHSHFCTIALGARQSKGFLSCNLLLDL